MQLISNLSPTTSSSIQYNRGQTLRASKAKHCEHQDRRFCTATIRSLKQIASIVGPDKIAVLSQDGKVRVVIGLTATNKQAPMSMHVEYEVTLPEHDWVVAQRHKLIPSVTAGIEVERNGLGQAEAVEYSRPTIIAIRSGKQACSTAYSHAFDFKQLLELEEFDYIVKMDGLVKPKVIITLDGGGPDEN